MLSDRPTPLQLTLGFDDFVEANGVVPVQGTSARSIGTGEQGAAVPGPVLRSFDGEDCRHGQHGTSLEERSS